jgi:hypothetical protein
MRLDPELTAAARSTARQMSRSVAQQIAHWARIGRELERSPDVTVAAVQAVLEGRGDYDHLNAREQAVVRARWAERIEQTRTNLRLDRVLAEKGREIVELAQDGTVAVRQSKAARKLRRVR